MDGNGCSIGTHILSYKPKKEASAAMRRPPFVHGVLVSVQAGELLLLDDLGDRAGGASVLASATGDAGVLVSDGSDVLELQNASGAGVDANATSDALVGINYGMSHGSFLSVDRRYRRCAPV